MQKQLFVTFKFQTNEFQVSKVYQEKLKIYMVIV